jgi:hypothetical protein
MKSAPSTTRIMIHKKAKDRDGRNNDLKYQQNRKNNKTKNSGKKEGNQRQICCSFDIMTSAVDKNCTFLISNEKSSGLQQDDICKDLESNDIAIKTRFSFFNHCLSVFLSFLF